MTQEPTYEISKSQLEEIAYLLDRAETFLGQGLCDHYNLAKLYDLNTQYRKGKIKKKEIFRKLDVCYPLGICKPEKVKEVQSRCHEQHNKIMKIIDPYHITREESADLLRRAFRKTIEDGIIPSALLYKPKEKG